MSLAQTMKDMETANKALEGQIAAMKADADAAVKTHATAIEQAKAQIAERDNKIADLNKQLAAAAQAADEAAKAKIALDAQIAQLTAEITKAKAVLANPAFADAAILGQKTPPKDGGDAKVSVTDDQFLAAYRAETDPEKRAAMWRARGEPAK